MLWRRWAFAALIVLAGFVTTVWLAKRPSRLTLCVSNQRARLPAVVEYVLPAYHGEQPLRVGPVSPGDTRCVVREVHIAEGTLRGYELSDGDRGRLVFGHKYYAGLWPSRDRVLSVVR